MNHRLVQNSLFCGTLGSQTSLTWTLLGISDRRRTLFRKLVFGRLRAFDEAASFVHFSEGLSCERQIFNLVVDIIDVFVKS